jgi:hypothetical protein
MPPTNPIWTLNASGITPAGLNGSDLAGCHITTNSTNTAYEFTEPNITKVKSTTTGSSLPSLPFTFPTFTYDGLLWTITVTSMTTGTGGSAAGTWNNPTGPVAEEGDDDFTNATSGDFTAQSGSKLDEDEEAEDEAAAHSAKAQGGNY